MGRTGDIRNFTAVSITALVLAGPVFGLDRAAAPGADSGNTDTARAGDEISVKGSVEHVDLEGGFWGVIGDDGKKYDVTNLPGEFRKQGLRVKFAGRVRHAQVSFHMWGIPVEVTSIEKIGETSK